MKIQISSCVILLLSISAFCQVNTPYGRLIFSDSLEFEPVHSWLSIDDPESSVWELGQPHKTFFNQSHSGARALVTDTSAYYGTNLNDAFTISIRWDDYFFAEGILSFYHKYDTDYKTDGGIVEISYDFGMSWINLHEEEEERDRNFIGLAEDTIDGGDYAYTGKSDGWEYVELQWIWVWLVKKDLVGFGDKVLVRFRFVSDEIDMQKEGWMIDDVVFRGYAGAGDIEGHTLNRVIMYPNPAMDVIYFRFDLNKVQNKEICLFNSLGKKIQSARIENNQLNISDLSSGIYFFKILSENEIWVCGKFVKH